eukprot:4402268-Alexandrium_andersonii.AAC.1
MTVLQEDKPAVRVNLKQAWLLKHAFGTVKADTDQKEAVYELHRTLKDLRVPVAEDVPAEAWGVSGDAAGSAAAPSARASAGGGRRLGV